MEACFDPDLSNTAIPDTSWFVEITAEVLRRGNHQTLMLFTRNEEAALLLKSDLLPGQQRDVQDREKQALVKGFMRALNALGRK
jgi:hypothetical protein